MAAGAGYSLKSSTFLAAEEAVQVALHSMRTEGAGAAVVFATPDHCARYPFILEEIRQRAGTEQVVGCSATGVITGGGEFEQTSLAVMLLSLKKISVFPFFMQNTKSGGELGMVAAKTRLPECKNSLLILFPDPYGFEPKPFFEELENAAGFVPCVGAYASGDVNENVTSQFHGKNIENQACSGIMLSGDFSYAVKIAQGARPISRPLIITSGEGHLISEIAGKPAFNVFAETVQRALLSSPAHLRSAFFAGIAVDTARSPLGQGDFLMRTIIGADSKEGVLAIAEEITSGQTIAFSLLNPLIAQQELEEMARSAREEMKTEPSFGFYFNCCGRGRGLYGAPNVDIKIIQKYFPKTPMIGFFGNGEIAPLHGKNFVHNYSGVLVLVSE